MSLEDDLVPELGDRITLLSKAYGRITGIILYRDERLIRVKPHVFTTSSRQFYDFSVNPETGEFDASLGVEQLQFHSKRSSPWYALQLAVLPDSEILLYTSDPTPTRARVLAIHATDEEDALTIQREGSATPERLDFSFRGPPPPLLFVEPTVSDRPVEVSSDTESLPDIELPLMEGAVTEVARADQHYSEHDQLEDMITTLLLEHPIERQKNTRLVSMLKQQAITLLSLKQSVQEKSYVASTLLDAIESTESPINSILPVANLRRSLYLEDSSQETELYVIQNELETFGKMITADTTGFNASSDSRGNRFAKYLSAVLTTGSGLTTGTLSTPYLPKRVQVEQEVFRAPAESRTRGLVGDLPAGRHVYNKFFKEDMKLKQRYIGDISHHFYRLVGEVQMKHPETGQEVQIVKADVLDPLQYWLLPPALADQRCVRTRTGVLLWDVQWSETVRSQSMLSMMIAESAMVEHVDESYLLADIIQDRLSFPFYNLSDPSLHSLLDELGMRTLEWTPELLTVVRKSLEESQTTWSRSHQDALKQSATSRANTPVLQSAVDASSSLLTSIDSNPLLQEISIQVHARESSLQGIDFPLAETLFTVTRHTRAPLWYLAAGGDSDGSRAAIEEQTAIVESEVMRQSTVRELSAAKELSYHAEPIQNSCEHVKELEDLRGVELEKDRMNLLDLFHHKYEGGLKENWVQCNICKQDLLCRHELLLLQEYKQKQDTRIFHKTLLIEFGDVFDGSYTCKNCGMAISEIEYDTNPEFDDEGNLMQGRSILANEQDAVTLDTLDLSSAIQDTELKESKMADDKLQIYHVIRDLFENAGANPSDAIYKKCVNAIYNQLLVMDNPYKERILSKLKARTPEDSVIVATLLVILSAAYVIAELQISEAALPIYITRQGCTFSRDGFPRDSEGTGVLDYMVCIVLQIEADNYPWTTTLWGALNGESRRKLVAQEIRYAIVEISKLPVIQDALQEALRKKETPLELEGPGRLFRSRLDAPSAITNAETFRKSLYQDSVQSLRMEVIGRTEALSQDIIQTAHQLAFQSKEDLRGQTKRLDGQCGRTRLSDMGTYGFGIVGLQSEGTQREIELLRGASAVLLHRDPSHSLGMTHFVTPWSARVHPPPPVLHVESLSFRLFLKACATGPTAGLPHEYGVDRICRRCGLRSPIEIFNLAVEEKYITEKEEVEKPGARLDTLRKTLQEIAEQKDAVFQQVLDEADIHTEHEAFLTLQDQIHLRRKVDPHSAAVPFPWKDRIALLVRDTPPLHQDWALFQTFFTSLTASTSEKDRIAHFIPVSNLIPTYMRKITNQYITLSGKAHMKASQTAMNAFATHFETIIATRSISVRTLLTLWITPLKRIANGIEYSVKGSKWFKSITFQHEELLQEVWKRQYKIVDAAIEELDNHENERYKMIVRTVLNRYTDLVGALLEIMIESVRISPLLRDTEFTDLVRWVTLGSISYLLDDTSELYDTETSFLRQSAAAFIGKRIFELFESVHVQLARINKSPEEIRIAIEGRKQQERQRFIQKQDKLASDAEKRADNLMKLFGLGDYSEGALKKKFTYDADYYEFHRDQRLEYGLPEFSEDISNRAVDGDGGGSGGGAPEEGGTFDEYIGANEQDD